MPVLFNSTLSTAEWAIAFIPALAIIALAAFAFPWPKRRRKDSAEPKC